MEETPALLQAVRELTAVTKALNKTLSEDYPKRREIERNYLSKQQSSRNIRFFVAFVFASIFISQFVTIATVSTCFLGDPEHPRICQLMPGYKDSIQQNKDILKHFQELMQITKQNDRRLDEIEGR